MDTLSANSFRLSSCQATLFTPDEEVSAAKLVTGLLPKWLDHFDADPSVLPLQEVVPRELPKLILLSKSGLWKCEIASARINLFWFRSKASDTEPRTQDFFTSSLRFLNEYVAFQRARVGRMAAVLKRYAEHPSPGSYLVAHFCQGRWLSGPMKVSESFELHVRTNYNLADKFRVNSWIRNKTGQVFPPDEKRPIILVEQDLNTLAEEAATMDFTTEDVEMFYTAAAVDSDRILRSYYP